MDEKRVSISRKFAAANRALNQLSDQARDHALEVGLDLHLIELIKLRASQINGCAACLAIHTKVAIEAGETAQRLGTLAAWRGNHLFSEQEQAALELTEYITVISEGHIDDELYAQLRDHLTDDQIAAVSWVAIIINSFNRISILNDDQP